MIYRATATLLVQARVIGLIDVSIGHPVPEVAKALADAVAREVITEMAADRFTGRSMAIDLLNKEVVEMRTRMQDAVSAQASSSRRPACHLPRVSDHLHPARDWG